MARPLAPGIEVAIRREPRHGWRGIAVAVRCDANPARRFAGLAGPRIGDAGEALVGPGWQRALSRKGWVMRLLCPKVFSAP